MIYHLLVAAAVVASASATANLSTQDPTHLKQLWDSFKEQFGRTYSTMDEENSRFKIFVENLKTIDQRNSEDTAIHGITRFSDLTQAEFEARYLTADPKMKTNDRELDLTARTVDTAAALVDWTGKLTTPVRDQGYCGSCWAFSATEQIESDGIRTGRWATNKYVSVEQVVQCDTTSYGCDGGWTEHAYNYVKSKGVGSDSSYPYTSYQGTTGKCPATTPTAVLKITGYKTLSGESNMASYVQTTGPLSVCVDASNWSSYKSGILSSCTKRVNHCVQAVGVDTAGGYWKVRNSWGTSWGEAGFIRLAYGANTCAITNDPTYVTF